MVYNFRCFFCQNLTYLSFVSDLCQTFCCFCDRYYCHLFFDNHVVGRCYCQLVVDWLMLLAIVADVKATFFICVNPQMLILADVIATFLG